MKRLDSHEAGRSMVEMLGVLAIVGVLSVGGIAGYSQAMSKFKITKAMDQVQTIITNVRTLYASQRTYTPLTANQAYAMGILTEESLGDGGTKGLNPFGGEIIFGVGNSAGANRSFTIQYGGLTPEACVKMATADWGADQSSGLLSMTVGSTTSKDGEVATTGTKFTWTDAGNPLPITLDKAATICSEGISGSVTWEYR